MSKTVKAVIFWAVIVVSATLLWQTVRSGADSPGKASEISYSAFFTQVSAGHVSGVTITGNVVRGTDDKGENFRVVVPSNQTQMIEALQQHGVEIWFRDTAEGNWPSWLLNLAPLVLLAALWFFMIRQIRIRTIAQQNMSGANQPPSESPRFGP